MEIEKTRSYTLWRFLKFFCELVAMFEAFMIMRWLTDEKIISLAHVPDFQLQCVGYMTFTYMIAYLIYQVIIPIASLIDDLFQI